MKARAKHTVNSIFLSMFVACFIILNTGCGLDEYYVVEGPDVVYYPVYTAQDPITFEHNYVEFSTNSKDESIGSFTIDGTDVYYKIYSSLSACSSEYSALNTLLNNPSSKTSSASSLINSYKFQKLKNNLSSSDVFVKHDGDSIRVRIRLTQYLEPTYSYDVDESKMDEGSAQYSPQISYFMNIGGEWHFWYKGSPVRYYDNRSFDFKRNSSTFKAPLPRSTSYEDDVSTNTSDSDDGFWYINLYAFTKGHDSSFTTYYSPIVHLGTLRIDANTYEN